MTPFEVMRFADNAGGGSAPYGSHLAWRIYVVDTNDSGSGRTTLAEILWKDGTGTQISTSGATIFEGGSGSVNNAASNAFDGNTATSRWSRLATGTCYIGTIFASAKSVGSVQMYSADWGSAWHEAPRSARVEYSDDTTNGTDGTWTTAFTIWERSWQDSAQSNRTWPQDTSGGKYKEFAWYPTLSADGTHMAMDEAELFTGGGSTDVVTSDSHYIASTGVTNPGNLIDDNTTNWTELGATNRFCGVAVPTPILITGYSLGKYQWLTEAWKDWTLKGTNDGSSWTTIDTRAGETWGVAAKKTYSV